jgi:hypothetical protein
LAITSNGKNGKAAGEEANQADSLATPNDAALLA